jgi:hypothetical protein
MHVDEARALALELLGLEVRIPSAFLAGGASLEFLMVPLI